MACCRWDFLIVVTIIAHVLACPFTKVEESFNVQAMHDVLFHRLDVEKFDHVQFPGVVPRTFLGAIAVSILSAPFVALSSVLGLPKLSCLYIVRVVLGLLTAAALALFRSSAQRLFRVDISAVFSLITASQFHLMFYASRPLPNTFALVLVLLSLSMWISGSRRKLVWSAALAVVVFRFELCLFLGPVLLLDVFNGLGTSRRFFLYLRHGVAACVVWIGLSVAADSYFWHRWLWPEGEVLWYNTVLNKSSDWGTSPFLWYFYSALPRMLLLTIPLSVAGFFFERKRLSPMLFSAFFFVFLYSFLPHKELRFVIYVVPVINLASAVGFAHVWRQKANLSWLFKVIAVACIAASAVLSSGFVYASHHNYPGGHALENLHQRLASYPGKVHLHICNAAAQSGVSRFGQENTTWRYSKKENLPAGEALLPYTHLIAEARDLHHYTSTHDLLFEVEALHKISWRSSPRGILTKKHLVGLQRKTPIISSA